MHTCAKRLFALCVGVLVLSLFGATALAGGRIEAVFNAANFS